jgi:hypothetical protein
MNSDVLVSRTRTELKLLSLAACMLSACFGVNSLAAQEAAPANLEVLTLERAVAQALENNRSIKISTQAVFQLTRRFWQLARSATRNSMRS